MTANNSSKAHKNQKKEQKKNTKIWEQNCGITECPPGPEPTGSDKDRNPSENQTETVVEPHDS